LPEPVDAILHGLRRRYHLITALRWFAVGAFYGCVAAVLLLIVNYIAGGEILGSPFQASWLVAGLAVAAGLLGFVAPTNELRLARALDRAADSEDRFASALQLASHHRQARAKLVLNDAMARVGSVRPESALPWRAPRELRMLPLPLIALVAFFFIVPNARTQADPVVAREISDDQWNDINEDVERKLAEFKEPKTDEERRLQDEMRKLADFLKQKPSKKEALERIARMRNELEAKRKAAGAPKSSLRKAARSMKSSKSLASVAKKLKAGDYNSAAKALSDLAKKLKSGEAKWSASEFEAAASDLQKLAQELGDEHELSEACSKCANAANSMNGERSAEEMEKLAKQLRENADRYQQCDHLSKCESYLDELKRCMNKKECKNCRNGSCSKCQGNGESEFFCRKPGGKGGLKPGWGTTPDAKGGKAPKGDDDRTPSLAQTRERAGRSTTYSVVSTNERAASGQSEKEIFAEMVRKAEADLDLESVPVSCRDYLGRYFRAIQPQEDDADKTTEASDE